VGEHDPREPVVGFTRPACIAVGFAGSQKTLPVSLALLELYYRDYPLAVGIGYVCGKATVKMNRLVQYKPSRRR